MTKKTGYTIQTMATRCGMTAHTLRYYERVGLIQPVWRGGNGHRRYSEQDEKWLRFIKSMRATHMPIREIQRFADRRESEDNRVDERRKILEGHRAALAEQIADLQEAHMMLTQNIEYLLKIEDVEPNSLSEPQRPWTPAVAAT
jgi:DNA-binding transcriptional MerR regulator